MDVAPFYEGSIPVSGVIVRRPAGQVFSVLLLAFLP